MLSLLYRKAKTHRPSSPTFTQTSKSSLQSSGAQIDVRAPALVSFRDRVILPLFKRLHERLTTHKDARPDACPRAQAANTARARVVALMGGDAVADRVYARPGPEGVSGDTAAARAARPDRDASPPATDSGRAVVPLRKPPTRPAGTYRAKVRHQQTEREQNAEGAAAAARGAQGAGDGGDDGWWGGRGRLPRGAREEWDDSEADVDMPRGGVTFPDVGRERNKEFLESLRCVVCFQ